MKSLNVVENRIRFTWKHHTDPSPPNILHESLSFLSLFLLLWLPTVLEIFIFSHALLHSLLLLGLLSLTCLFLSSSNRIFPFIALSVYRNFFLSSFFFLIYTFVYIFFASYFVALISWFLFIISSCVIYLILSISLLFNKFIFFIFVFST